MIYSFGDLLQQKGILVHQVNCFRIGAGLALDIINKWPEVRTQYVEHVAANSRRRLQLLGSVLFVPVEKDPAVIVANVFGQYKYGSNAKFTSYPALKQGLEICYAKSQELNLPLYIPFRIGCGHGGGIWREVEPLIREAAPNAVIIKYSKHPKEMG